MVAVYFPLLILRGGQGAFKLVSNVRNISKLKILRKKLRRGSTYTERLLWEKLRNHRFENYKFYRQYSFGNYILDFYCPELKIAIELDGGHHALENQVEYDQLRSRFLNEHEVRVLRFWNNEVLKNIDGVMGEIYREVDNLSNLGGIKRPLAPS